MLFFMEIFFPLMKSNHEKYMRMIRAGLDNILHHRMMKRRLLLKLGMKSKNTVDQIEQEGMSSDRGRTDLGAQVTVQDNIG